MFELRETGDWNIFLGPPEQARAETGGADQWVWKRRVFPGFVIVKGKKRPHPSDAHHQFSMKTPSLLSKGHVSSELMVQMKQKGVHGVENPLPRSFLGGWVWRIDLTILLSNYYVLVYIIKHDKFQCRIHFHNTYPPLYRSWPFSLEVHLPSQRWNGIWWVQGGCLIRM